MIVTAKGQAIHFRESDIRETGRTSMGVRGMRLGKGDYVISSDVIHKESNTPTLMVISQNGYGKRTDVDEYKVQNRGGIRHQDGQSHSKNRRADFGQSF